MKNLILLPTYNERENVEIIIKEIFALLPNIHILVIDDNSPDKTAEVVKNLMKQYPNLDILERQEKQGLGAAYKDAITKSIRDKDIYSIITMDADGSHATEYLPVMLINIKEYDLIIGSRYVKGGGVEDWEFFRKKLSSFGNLYAKFWTGLKINDLTAGFVCVRREILEKINFDHISSSGYAYQIEFKFMCAYTLGARVKEIPIIFKSRRQGESKISNQVISEGVILPIKLFFKRLWKR
ncbi:polyprenol monophosphomannose synthase [bacterium]|jgi:dolichol-phosphate mannosyltransferase|nr:polyprenol monophosphomannose synthase [bacterium]MBT4649404.1 polyprenol monophosphomannose synthase [bacterium]